MAALAASRLPDMVGEKIWFRATRPKVNTGVITKILGTGHVQITTDEGFRHAHANDIFLTRWDLLAAIRNN